MSYQDAEQEAIKLSEDNLKLKAELSKIHYTEKQWICDSHQWPYGAESTCGPICPWCERLKVEKLEAELAKAKADNARLEAALQRLKTVAQLWNNAPGEVPYHCWEVVNDISKAATSAAVHQLLGPIEDALEMGITSVHSHPEAVQDACRTALSRLRKVIGEKA